MQTYPSYDRQIKKDKAMKSIRLATVKPSYSSRGIIWKRSKCTLKNGKIDDLAVFFYIKIAKGIYRSEAIFRCYEILNGNHLINIAWRCSLKNICKREGRKRVEYKKIMVEEIRKQTRLGYPNKAGIRKVNEKYMDQIRYYRKVFHWISWENRVSTLF